MERRPSTRRTCAGPADGPTVRFHPDTRTAEAEPDVTKAVPRGWLTQHVKGT